MRILHVIQSVDPASGGPAEGLRQLSQIYQTAGHESHVATFDAPDAVGNYRFPAQVFALGPGRGIYGYAPKAASWLERSITAYDVVFINTIWQYSALATYHALKSTSIGYGVFVHGMLDPYFKRSFPLKHLKKSIYWHMLLQPVLHNADAVLFTCEEERILAKQSFARYRVRERVLNFGIFGPDLDLADAAKEFLQTWPSLQGKRLAISLGRLHPKKGIDILIEAYAAGIAKYPEWHLVIAGPDEAGEKARLQALAARLKVADRITWTGMLNGSLKWGALAAADMLVMPSHQENFGIVVAEALACKLPVIISDKVNIWREIAERRAGLVCEDTASSTQMALIQWHSLSRAEIKEMRVRSRRCFDACFNYDVVADKVLEVTESIYREKLGR
jgi:glycosyltransferase involved in cell wall biosynthesis